MGCTPGDISCGSDERPLRSVTLSAFQIGETEVTLAQWEAVMGRANSDPNFFNFSSCDQCPVNEVSWYDAVVFCNRMSELKGLKPCYYSDAGYTQVYGKSGGVWSLPNSGVVYRNTSAKGYRLPTEAEWEYAARGGSTLNIYSGSNNADGVAWCNTGSINPVKRKFPNGYGLYDMSGNVSEWCADWYGSYPSTAQSNPTGPSSSGGSGKVVRGGSWNNFGLQGCRVTARGSYSPSDRNLYSALGFRLALSN